MPSRWQQWHSLVDVLRSSSSSPRLAGTRALTVLPRAKPHVLSHGECRRCYATAPSKYSSTSRQRSDSRPARGGKLEMRIGSRTWSQEHDFTGITRSFLVKLKKGEKAQVAAGQPPRLRFEPEEYVHVLNLWLRIRKDAGPSWPLQLAPESRPSKEILHDLGVLLADLAESNHPAASPGEAHLAMLAGAAALGCDASTISLTRWWNARFPQTDMALSNLFRPVAARFREILNKGNNPYALTVEALRLVNTDKPQAALRFVNRVAQVTDVESFPWKDLLESCQSKSQLQREDVSAALEAARDPSQQRSQAAMETLMKHSPLAAERRRAAERHFMIEPNLVSLRFLAEDDAGSEPAVGDDAQKAADIIQKEWKLLYETMKEDFKEAER